MTIAFSDVQQSTYQWEQFPDSMSEAMEIHNQVLREKLQITGGYEVKTEGDSFMVAFRTPVTAVWWCLFCQEALMNANWPPNLLNSPFAREEYDEAGNLIFRGLRVRMGAHMGKPECRIDQLTRRMDYYGGMVNRSARVAGIAHGGQIFVSGKVWEACVREVDDVVVEYLGEHFLKGLKSSENIVQILPKRLAGVKLLGFFTYLQRKFPPLITKRENPLQSQEMLRFPEYEQSEEAAEKDLEMSERTTQKLTAIVNEIDATLRSQQEKRFYKSMAMEIKAMEDKTLSMNDTLQQLQSEEELLKYQIEKSKKKNLLYEQDVAQTK